MTDHFVTLNFVLVTLNSGLLLIAGYLLRDAWRTVHARIDALEERQAQNERAVAMIEGTLYGRRTGDAHA